MENFQSSLNIEIAENKDENLYFFIQIDKDIYSKFFNTEIEVEEAPKIPGEEIDNESQKVKYIKTQLIRIDCILEEITKLVRLRGFVSTMTAKFGLYLINLDQTVMELISLTDAPNFIEKAESVGTYIMGMKSNILNLKTDFKVFCLDKIFDFIDIKNYWEINNNSLEYFSRFIVFYNTSSIPVYFNKHILQEIPNFPTFYLDIIYLHPKISNQKDKEVCEKVFQSLNVMKCSSWYSFENSGNLQDFQYNCYLLMCSPSLRIKQTNIKKHQQNIESNLHICKG